MIRKCCKGDARDSKLEHHLCYWHLAVVICGVIRRRIWSSASLLSTCHPPPCWVLHPSSLFVLTPSDHTTSSTPASSNRPALSTHVSCCVVQHPIPLQCVLHPTPLVILFAAQSPCIACHPLISVSPPSLLLRCPPPACLMSSTAPSFHVIHCPLTPHILYLDLIVSFPLLLSPLHCNCPP